MGSGRVRPGPDHSVRAGWGSGSALALGAGELLRAQTKTLARGPAWSSRTSTARHRPELPTGSCQTPTAPPPTAPRRAPSGRRGRRLSFGDRTESVVRARRPGLRMKRERALRTEAETTTGTRAGFCTRTIATGKMPSACSVYASLTEAQASSSWRLLRKPRRTSRATTIRLTATAPSCQSSSSIRTAWARYGGHHGAQASALAGVAKDRRAPSWAIWWLRQKAQAGTDQGPAQARFPAPKPIWPHPPGRFDLAVQISPSPQVGTMLAGEIFVQQRR